MILVATAWTLLGETLVVEVRGTNSQDDPSLRLVVRGHFDLGNLEHEQVARGFVELVAQRLFDLALTIDDEQTVAATPCD